MKKRDWLVGYLAMHFGCQTRVAVDVGGESVDLPLLGRGRAPRVAFFQQKMQN
jgi:hypothetical protein